MLITSNKDFEKEASRLGIVIDKPINPEVASIEIIERGRPLSRTEVPELVRKFVAEESLEGVPAKQLSRIVGVSESSISAYKVGATSTSTYNQPDKELGLHVNKMRKAISKKAEGRLTQALESLTDEKIASAKAKDIATIAREMAAVVKNMEAREDDSEGKGPQVQFVFFAPKIKSEEYFGEPIEVSE